VFGRGGVRKGGCSEGGVPDLVLVRYPRNDSFVGRTAVLHDLQELPLKFASQARVALCGLGGIG
jgi:hypothetical protein